MTILASITESSSSGSSSSMESEKSTQLSSGYDLTGNSTYYNEHLEGGNLLCTSPISSLSNPPKGSKHSGIQPLQEVTIVFSDITRAASLWEFNPLAMRDATILHNQILRSLLVTHQVCAISPFNRYHSAYFLLRIIYLHFA